MRSSRVLLASSFATLVVSAVAAVASAHPSQEPMRVARSVVSSIQPLAAPKVRTKSTAHCPGGPGHLHAHGDLDHPPPAPPPSFDDPWGTGQLTIARSYANPDMNDPWSGEPIAAPSHVSMVDRDDPWAR